VANKNLVAIATLANEIFTVLEKIFVKFQTSKIAIGKLFFTLKYLEEKNVVSEQRINISLILVTVNIILNLTK
jgi:hypothetical protein